MSSSSLRCRLLVLEFVLLIIASVVFSETLASQDPDADYGPIPFENLSIEKLEKERSPDEPEIPIPSGAWITKKLEEERSPGGEPKKAKNTAGSRGDRKKGSWQVLGLIKKILDKSDAKTIIFAKDSTFNFYNDKVFEHGHSKNKAGAVAKGNQKVAQKSGKDSVSQNQNGDVTESPAPVVVDVTSLDDVRAPSSGSEGSGYETVLESGHAAGGLIDFEMFLDNETLQESTETTTTADTTTADTTTTEAVVSGGNKDNKYVYISSSLPAKTRVSGAPSHLVLDVDFADNRVEGDSRRIVLSANDQALSEQWHIDNEMKAIHNRQGNLCVSFTVKNKLVASPCNPANERQWWIYDHARRSLYNPHYDLVAEVNDAEAEVGGKINVGTYIDQPRQHFELGSLPFFFALVNDETKLALSVFGDRDRPGTMLVLTELVNPPTVGQLWYFDSKNVLRTKINENVIDGSSGTFRSEPFAFETVDTASWTFFDRHIINLNDERQVMEPVPRENDTDLFTLAPKRRNEDRTGQKFQIVYADKTEAA